MKIAVLTNSYPPQPGGASRIAEISVQVLRSMGHEVKVFDESPAYREFRSHLGIVRLGLHVRDLFPRWDVSDRIVVWKPNLLLTQNVTACGWSTSRRIQEIAGIPWIHVLHDVQMIEPSGQIVDGESFSGIRNLWRRTWSRLRKKVMGHPSLILSPTQWLWDFHRQFSVFTQERVEILPNPMDWEFVADRGPRPLSVCYVGRLDEDKGVGDLLEAWKQMAMPGATLILIGSGALEEWIRRLNLPGVQVMGVRSPIEVRAQMCASRVVVVPSRVWENQPTTVLEGLAAGCRVIATTVGGIPETLDGAGLLIPPADPASLADAMRRALQDAKWMDGAEHVVHQHALTVYAERLGKCLDRARADER